METIAERFINVGNGIKEYNAKRPNQPDFVYLKELEDYCNVRLFHSPDSNEKFFCFYLSRLIDSFFSNLGGDTPYDAEIQSARISFNAIMSDGLIKLGENIKENQINATYGLLSDMTNKYITLINYLNKE